MELIGFEIDEMARILRLLQLFAEGHYNELQNYVRQQHNNYHSYDILSDIINLLSIYMQTKDSRFFESMMQCFDTITEYIQGPCYENQVSIIQGSFLDIASSLFSVISKIAFSKFNFECVFSKTMCWSKREQN